jgi:PAS domain S-box-containing protein
MTGILIIDAKTKKIVEANPLAQEIIGTPRDNIIGKTCHDFICAAEKGKFPVTDLGKTIDRSERELIRADGTCIPVLKTVVLVNIKGRQYLIDSFMDISERKQMEAQLIHNEKLASLGSLVSGIAHELNNPLAGILGYIQLFQDDDRFKDISQQLEKMGNAAIRCKKIVDNLLHFSRKKDPEKICCDVNKILQRCIDILAHQFDMLNLDLKIELTDKPLMIFGDPYQLEQVFVNLIKNALDAIKDVDNGHTSIQSKRKDTRAVILITDNGPGIPKVHQKNIFDPFFTTKAVGEGTGLGLSLAYGIITSHNGTLSLQPTTHGASFKIELELDPKTNKDQNNE